MWTNPQFSVDLFTFTKKAFNRKPHFCTVTKKRCLSVNFVKLFRTATLKNIFDRLPLLIPCFLMKSRSNAQFKEHWLKIILSILDHSQMFHIVASLKSFASVYNFTTKNKSKVGVIFETPQNFPERLCHRATLNNFLFEFEWTPTTDFDLAFSDKHLHLLIHLMHNATKWSDTL